MKEIIDLHQKIMDLPEENRPESGVHFSRPEEDREGVDELPVALQAELASMHRAINDGLPEDFDYFVFVGQSDEEPAFHLEHDRMAAGGSEDNDLFQAAAGRAHRRARGARAGNFARAGERAHEDGRGCGHRRQSRTCGNTLTCRMGDRAGLHGVLSRPRATLSITIPVTTRRDWIKKRA